MRRADRPARGRPEGGRRGRSRRPGPGRPRHSGRSRCWSGDVQTGRSPRRPGHPRSPARAARRAGTSAQRPRRRREQRPAQGVPRDEPGGVGELPAAGDRAGQRGDQAGQQDDGESHRARLAAHPREERARPDPTSGFRKVPSPLNAPMARLHGLHETHASAVHGPIARSADRRGDRPLARRPPSPSAS